MKKKFESMEKIRAGVPWNYGRAVSIADASEHCRATKRRVPTGDVSECKTDQPGQHRPECFLIRAHAYEQDVAGLGGLIFGAAFQRSVRTALTLVFRENMLFESANSFAGGPSAQTRPASMQTT